jgi:iron complex transport system permease protein
MRSTAVPRRPRTALRFALALAALGAVVVAGIALGAVRIPLDVVWRALLGQEVQPPYDVIVHDVRLPRTLTATLVGASLGIAGLQMQTLFRNPLADPFILGVSSGASLGVALVVLAVGASGWTGSFASGLGGGGDVGIVMAAATGAATVMGLVLLVGRCVTSSTTLLLLGVMFSYLVSALVTVLLAGATPELVHQYIQWNFGSYRGVTWSNLHVLVPVLVCGLLACLLLPKHLNALLLGERYATTMGVDVPVTRTMIIVVTAVLAGTATAFCGPVQFLGIAVPHLCRALFSTSDHRVLLPACAVLGAALALGADVLAQLPGDEVLPLNAVNAAIGAPVVIYVLVRRSPSGTPA